jgi:F-type H+-transporting ATPase subunit b
MSNDTHPSPPIEKGANPLIVVILGVILIVVGVAIQTQPWTRPEMFKGLDLDFSKVVVNAGVFLIFVQVLNIYFYAPLKEAMDERNGQLEKTFTEAEELRDSMTALKSNYERRLADTESQARAQIESQIKEAQSLRQTLVSEAAAKADDLVRQATAEIEAEKIKAITDIRLHVVDLTLSATEKILGQTVDAEINKRLVAEFIDRVEVAP